MVFLKWWFSVLLLSTAAWAGTSDNEVFRTVRSGSELVSAVAEDCIAGDEPMMTCLRHKVLSYVNHISGVHDESEGRGLSDSKMDAVIAKRLKKYFNSHELKIQLPKFLFEEAVLTFNPSRGLADFKVDFPEEKTVEEDRSMAAARGHLKKKLLLPLLLLLKLKIKALTPLLLIIVGIKAVKAFIMSKISLLLVVGFMLLQLFKKGGMMMPMAMMPAPISTEPPPVYGPPQTSPTYGPPAPTPDTSYGPWEPSNTPNNGNGNGNGNPYSRWDSHSLAYSAHQPEGVVKSSQQLQPGV